MSDLDPTQVREAIGDLDVGMKGPLAAVVAAAEAWLVSVSDPTDQEEVEVVLVTRDDKGRVMGPVLLVNDKLIRGADHPNGLLFRVPLPRRVHHDGEHLFGGSGLNPDALEAGMAAADKVYSSYDGEDFSDIRRVAFRAAVAAFLAHVEGKP